MRAEVPSRAFPRVALVAAVQCSLATNEHAVLWAEWLHESTVLQLALHVLTTTLSRAADWISLNKARRDPDPRIPSGGLEEDLRHLRREARTVNAKLDTHTDAACALVRVLRHLCRFTERPFPLHRYSEAHAKSRWPRPCPAKRRRRPARAQRSSACSACAPP